MVGLVMKRRRTPKMPKDWIPLFRRKAPIGHAPISHAPASDHANRWTVARQLVGLAAFVESCPCVYQHKLPIKAYRVPGTPEALKYSTLLRRANEFMKIHDHYEVRSTPGLKVLHSGVDLVELVKALDGVSGLFVLDVNGQEVWRGESPHWDAQHWYLFLYGDKGLW